MQRPVVIIVTMVALTLGWIVGYLSAHNHHGQELSACNAEREQLTQNLADGSETLGKCVRDKGIANTAYTTVKDSLHVANDKVTSLTKDNGELRSQFSTCSAALAKYPPDSPTTEREQVQNALTAVVQVCGFLGKGGFPGPLSRCGLMDVEIADYIALMRRDLREDTLQANYEIKWQSYAGTQTVGVGGGPFVAINPCGRDMTHAEGLVCLREMMDFVKRFPVDFIADGKVVPLATLLTESRR